MRRLLPHAARPYLFAALQAFVTTGASTFIAVMMSPSQDAIRWLAAWFSAWLVLVPLVLVMAPLLWRLVDALSKTAGQR